MIALTVALETLLQGTDTYTLQASLPYIDE